MTTNRMDSNDVLTALDVCREFETPEAVLSVLKGVNLKLGIGEMATVTGPSGVGKSTLLHILGGLDKPTSGEVTVSGKSLVNESEQSLARFRNAKIGFVFQFHYLLDDFTALENVALPLLVAGCDSKEAKDKAEHLLSQVVLTDRTGHLPRQLSGGEQQRVAVARALANDPEIVLADEPSGNLDTETGRTLHDLLFRLNAENKTSFLIATHNQELAKTCPRQFRMIDGHIFE